MLYADYPPEYMSLYDLNAIEVKKLKSGEHDMLWFNSPAAGVDPVLFRQSEDLLKLSNITDDNFMADFRSNLPPQLTIGGILETLRFLNKSYVVLTGPLSDWVERLSRVGFFELRKPI